jgi:hypothetical protein
MYCPACGSEERQMSQYCRACGTDLRPVRLSLERPDSVTASAVTAREEIGRAVAEQIRDMEGSRDLKRVAEDVLPQIEKFLESPEEKRLRRMRAGVITAVTGFGAGILGLLVVSALQGSKDADAIPIVVFLMGLGVITFLIGIGMLLNGLLFTKPPHVLKDTTSDAQTQTVLDRGYAPPPLHPASENPELFRTPSTSDLAAAELRPGPSITEHTTHQLKTER